MNIFISWSGEKAQRVAAALKKFLLHANDHIIPWFSDTDISAGDRWSHQLASQLEVTDFGIVCTTQESIQSPWILFEAGALSRSLSGGRVCPYLIDLNRKQLGGPLAQFQAKEATPEQSWQLLQGINLLMQQNALPEAQLHANFEAFWPALAAEITNVNRNLRPIPHELRQMMLTVLPMIVEDAGYIRMYAHDAELPTWQINWNQSALQIWNDLLLTAATEQRVTKLIAAVYHEYAENSAIQQLMQEVDQWIN